VFRTVPLSIIRSFSLYTQQWHVIQVCCTCFGQFLCPSSGVFHSTHNNVMCHTGFLYMFRTVPLSNIRSFSLYTQQWYMSYRFALHVSDSSSVHHQGFFTVHTAMAYVIQVCCTCFGQFFCPSSGGFHCTHSNGICHTGLLYMFRTVPLSIIRSFSLYTQQYIEVC